MSQVKNTTHAGPAPETVAKGQDAFATSAFSHQPTHLHAHQVSAEAANLARLGNYSFVYAMLIALADLGLLAMMTTLGVPLEGVFGGLALCRLLLRLAAATAFALVLYAWICSADFKANGWRRPGLQFLCVALFFVLLGVDRGDLTMPILRLLQWLGDHGPYLRSCCGPDLTPV